MKERDKYYCLCCGETKKHLLVVDHINPKYHGGDHSLNNLQTLCRTCNTLKETETISFRIHPTPLNAPKATFPHPEFTQPCYVDARQQLQIYLRRSVNFLYYCDAVKHIDIDVKGRSYQPIWQISLHPGNDPRWLLSHHKYLFGEILQARRKAGFSNPESIIINAPGFDVIAPITV